MFCLVNSVVCISVIFVGLFDVVCLFVAIGWVLAFAWLVVVLALVVA